jgi:hypothetical protein
VIEAIGTYLPPWGSATARVPGDDEDTVNDEDRGFCDRFEASNQVDGARWALGHNVGGPTAVSAITILSTDRG